MYLVDTHNHLGCALFDKDRSQILAQSIKQGVVRQIMIGVFAAEWYPLLQLADKHSALYMACGIHPMYIPATNQLTSDLNLLKQLFQQRLDDQKLCAFGEIGLDYYIANVDKELQLRVFNNQLELATFAHRPVLLHVRRAHADVIATLKDHQFKYRGIVHAFSGSYEEAKEYIKLGFKIGLGGAGTYPQARRMHKILKQLPLEAIVLETDAPDLSPVSRQGQRNSPEYLPEICQQLAQIKGISTEQLAYHSSKNACDLFNWSFNELTNS